MDEYISKQVAIDAIKKIYCPQCNSYNGVICRACEHMDDMDIIEDMPAADVQPVKRGRWIGFGERFSEDWICSNCQRERGKGNSSNYCSFCGARMECDTDAKVDI